MLTGNHLPFVFILWKFVSPSKHLWLSIFHWTSFHVNILVTKKMFILWHVVVKMHLWLMKTNYIIILLNVCTRFPLRKKNKNVAKDFLSLDINTYISIHRKRKKEKHWESKDTHKHTCTHTHTINPWKISCHCSNWVYKIQNKKIGIPRLKYMCNPKLF